MSVTGVYFYKDGYIYDEGEAGFFSMCGCVRTRSIK